MLILTFAMVFILVVSIFAAVNLLYEEHSKPEFFVGVEMAYSNATFADVKDLVDKVKDYTNLVVIGSPEISKNQTLLNMTCDYIVDAGLNFVVLFTDTQMYSVDNSPKDWIPRATQKYGERFLAVYRYDEPGGGVLDHAHDSLIDETVVGRSANYSYASKLYVEYLYAHLSYYLVPSPSVLTADYGLFWFDYKSGYGTVLAELGSNHSREINVALCRGAGLARNRDWGTIITWKYNKTPYVESPDELYQDLVLSFRAGAKYAVVFDYPKVGRYGILNQTHLDKLSDFGVMCRAIREITALTAQKWLMFFPLIMGLASEARMTMFGCGMRTICLSWLRMTRKSLCHSMVLALTSCMMTQKLSVLLQLGMANCSSGMKRFHN